MIPFHFPLRTRADAGRDKARHGGTPRSPHAWGYSINIPDLWRDEKWMGRGFSEKLEKAGEEKARLEGARLKRPGGNSDFPWAPSKGGEWVETTLSTRPLIRMLRPRDHGVRAYRYSATNSMWTLPLLLVTVSVFAPPSDWSGRLLSPFLISV